MVSRILNESARSPYDADLMLVDRFLAGDESAFTRIYEDYYPRVFALARGILIDSDETEDAVQEVFTQIYRNLVRFDRRSKLSTWIFRITVNRTIQYGRTLKFKRRQVELEQAAHQAAPDAALSIADPRIASAMRKLVASDRAVLTLYYWQELSLAEIGQSLGCNENAAKTRLFRARDRFKKLYEAELG